MLKELIIFFTVFVSCFGVKYDCSISGETCTITGLQVTQSDFKIEPVAPNPSIVTAVILKGTVTILTSALTSGICKTLPNLKEFQANYVSMEVVENFAFRGCEKLEIIAMEFNRFKKIEKNSFKQLRNLKTLHLFSGNLPVLDIDLSDSPELHYLVLPLLSMTVFPYDILQGKKELKDLYLYSNNLFDLDIEEILKNSPNLQRIYLKDNNFKCSRLREILRLLKARKIDVGTHFMGEHERKRDYTPLKIDEIHCLSDEQWFELYLKNSIIVPQLQSKIETIKQDNDKQITNYGMTIETLSKKHDQDQLKLNHHLEVAVQKIINIMTNQSKLFDEKFQNITLTLKSEQDQINQQNQDENNFQDYHNISLWTFTTVTFFICIIFIGYYCIRNRRRTSYVQNNEEELKIMYKEKF